MSTEFNDGQHYGFFMNGTKLTSASGFYTRWSELVLASLRAQGVFGNMVDGTTPPAADKLWLDKNTDPAVLKEWDSLGSAWVPMTFDRLFGRAVVTELTVTGGTGNAVVVSQPPAFISDRLYSIVPTSTNTGATTIQVTGVGTFDLAYPDGSDIEEAELKAGKPSIMLFKDGEFQLVFGYGAQAAAEAAADYVTGVESVTAAESGVYPNQVLFLQLLGRGAYGDGGAFKAVEVTEDGTPLGPGQFKTNVNLKRWENTENVITPAMFSDLSEMFAFTKAEMRIPKANYEFDGFITIRNNAVIRCEEGAMFMPTFEPVGADRNTPLIDLGVGCDINYLKTHLVAGIDTVRTMVKAGGGCRVGHYIATSVNLNNNRAAGGADADAAGALLITGTGNRIDLAEIDMHDSAINIDNATRTRLGRVIETNFVTGIAGRDSSIVDIGSVYASAVDPAISLAMSTPRGNMTPGANAIVWGGVERVAVGDVEAYNILEHTIRLGAKQPDGTITNERHSYGNIKTFAPYGCGFKMDDADAFTIKRVQIKTLYTEDVGHGVWGQPNDGNKAGCAVRNAEFVQIGLYMNRAVNYVNSGNDGLWIEKSSEVQVGGADVQNARGYGVLINPNGLDVDHVTVTGIRSAFNGKSGVGVIPASNNNMRGIYLEGVSSNNTEYGVEVTARTDGTSPFVTEPTTIAVTVRNNTLGGKSIADVVVQDGDFFDEIVDRNPSFSATKGGAAQTAIPSATVTAVTFGTEVRDVGGYFAGNVWTPPRGRYDISASIEFTAGIVTGEAYTILIRVAGVTVSENFVRAQGTTSLQVSIRDIIEVDGTQAISISCFGGGAGDKTISGAASKTFFRGEKLSGLTV
ncbi:hypothetical protein [Sinorhizobium meliloti]|uniref:hypothetical protein n=1 Tax=Rhizobium meliloti TaxID=382 RepID=UPI0018658C3F|nr:hypothetical protein [Sinorhizobium meliloti]